MTFFLTAIAAITGNCESLKNYQIKSLENEHVIITQNNAKQGVIAPSEDLPILHEGNPLHCKADSLFEVQMWMLCQNKSLM